MGVFKPISAPSGVPCWQRLFGDRTSRRKLTCVESYGLVTVNRYLALIVNKRPMFRVTKISPFGDVPVESINRVFAVIVLGLGLVLTFGGAMQERQALISQTIETEPTLVGHESIVIAPEARDVTVIEKQSGTANVAVTRVVADAVQQQGLVVLSDVALVAPLPQTKVESETVVATVKSASGVSVPAPGVHAETRPASKDSSELVVSLATWSHQVGRGPQALIYRRSDEELFYGQFDVSAIGQGYDGEGRVRLPVKFKHGGVVLRLKAKF